MHPILVWPLSDTLKIFFVASDCDLNTVTCCDSLAIQLQHQDQSYMVASDLVGCSFGQLKDMLEKFIEYQQKQIQFKDIFFIAQDQCGNILLEIRKNNVVVCYHMISISMIQAWIAQLDLLLILMEENEHAKKSNGKGCC